MIFSTSGGEVRGQKKMSKSEMSNKNTRRKVEGSELRGEIGHSWRNKSFFDCIVKVFFRQHCFMFAAGRLDLGKNDENRDKSRKK